MAINHASRRSQEMFAALAAPVAGTASENGRPTAIRRPKRSVIVLG